VRRWFWRRRRAGSATGRPPQTSGPARSGSDGSARPGAGGTRGVDTGRSGDDLLSRFGKTCPVCGAGLGLPPDRDSHTGRFTLPPGFRLEVGPADRENRQPWRVSTLGVTFPPAASTDPAFSDREIDYVYLLCGGGHIFPDAAPVFRADALLPDDARQHIDGWNMVAALGAPASGKTYLLLRMLNQNLDNTENLEPRDDDAQVRVYQLNPLEEIPLAVRNRMYGDTLSAGHAIPATNMDSQGTPAGILGVELPDALDAIKDIIGKTVLDGQRRAREWGTGFRQPLVLRTTSRGRRTWTGVADLPGELFAPDTTVPRERVKLRAYDALVWVVDPVVAAPALDRLAEDSLDVEASYHRILDGSLRPGTTAAAGRERVRTNRDQIQVEIGRHLTRVDGIFTVDQGASLRMLVAITKCDIIHAALGKKRLGDLGEPGVVNRGVTTFLAFLTNRWGRGEVEADPASTYLLDYLWGGAATDPAVRRRRSQQVATGFLEHYSAQEAFWNLAHLGNRDHVVIGGGDDLAIQQIRLEVPSIGDHLDSSLLPGSAHQILLRDLVMSAVGCGLSYGLGHEAAIFRALNERWQQLRFFLCSPLATVPMSTEDELLSPLESTARFPKAHDRSAALTQLLLAAIGKARG